MKISQCWQPLLLGSLFGMSLPGCGDESIPSRAFQQDMRDFVIALSGYARGKSPGFVVVPQNGQDLVSTSGTAQASYLAAIHGQGREDLYYGYDDDDKATDSAVTNNICKALDTALAAGKTILVTDYCSTKSKMDDSHTKNSKRGYVSFAASSRDLDLIPSHPAAPRGEHAGDVKKLSEAKNFLYLIKPDQFSNTKALLDGLSATNFDLLIMDAFTGDQTPLSAADVSKLKRKKNGGTRLVLAYMSIGEAETYRFYWDKSWEEGSPSWLDEENPEWEGNYKVRYWDPRWQAVIYGSANAYLDRILAAGFDGVYLDIIDAYQYYENRAR